jgi:hypothetical protein
VPGPYKIRKTLASLEGRNIFMKIDVILAFITYLQMS